MSFFHVFFLSQVGARMMKKAFKLLTATSIVSVDEGILISFTTLSSLA